MCGLCGVLSTTVSDFEFEKFIQLFNVSSLRGEHSSGLLSVKELEKKEKNKKDKILYSATTLKGVGPSGWFAEQNWQRIKETIHDASNTIFVAGHCRHATRGTISSSNAHPFNFTNIVGMHNGTLNDNIGTKVTKKDKKGNTVAVDETDSESFFRYLNDHTIEEALSELKFNDAYAFVWYNKVEHTLNFIRNDKRPLWIAQVNASTIYWASEKEMLQFILNRNFSGNYVNTIDKLAQIPENTLVTFKVDAANPVNACTIRKIEITRKHSYSSHYGGENHFRLGRGWDDWDETRYYTPGSNYNPLDNDRPGDDELPFEKASGGQTTEALNDSIKKTLATMEETINRKPSSNVITLPFVKTQDDNEEATEAYKTFNETVSKKEYQRKLENGCAWCSSQAVVTDKVRWLSNTEYICSDCLSDPEVKAYLNESKSAIG